MTYKPCPFCAQPPRVEFNGSHISCANPECVTVAVYEDDPAKAALRWNARPTEPARPAAPIEP